MLKRMFILAALAMSFAAGFVFNAGLGSGRSNYVGDAHAYDNPLCPNIFAPGVCYKTTQGRSSKVFRLKPQYKLIDVQPNTGEDGITVYFSKK